jgi:hypothetical protein
MRARIEPFWAVAMLLLAALLCHAQTIGSSREDPLLRQKADTGDSGAQYELGVKAEQRQNYREAFRWLHLGAIRHSRA